MVDQGSGMLIVTVQAIAAGPFEVLLDHVVKADTEILSAT